MGSDKEVELVGQYVFSAAKGIYNFFKNVYSGIKKLPESKLNYIGLILTIALGIGLFIFKEYFWLRLPKNFVLIRYLFYASPVLPLLYLYCKGEDYAKFMARFEEKFESISFFSRGKRKRRNLNGEMVETKDYPIFLGEQAEGKKIIYSFKSNISLQEWRSRYLDLETALDCNIVKIENAKNSKQIVKLHTVPTDQGIKDYIPWSDDYIREKEFEITVGVAMLEDVVFNLDKVPHGLIGGVTGSGKSVILQCILWQCIKKGAKPYMFDFKGGVEFGKKHEQFGEVVIDRTRAIEILKDLISENAARLTEFRELGVKSLGEYNRASGNRLCRIVVVCDEVAEMLDKTGLSKNEKKQYEEIESYLSSLARLARVTGIHLMLGTQRPDAKVITGQIKNNLSIRISGRMVDPQASEMVLGNTKATMLPEIQGRFMYNIGADTFEFQAYKFDDAFLIHGNYQKGDLLMAADESIGDELEEKFIEPEIKWVAEREANEGNMEYAAGRKGGERSKVLSCQGKRKGEVDMYSDYEGF